MMICSVELHKNVRIVCHFLRMRRLTAHPGLLLEVGESRQRQVEEEEKKVARMKELYVISSKTRSTTEICSSEIKFCARSQYSQALGASFATITKLGTN